MNDAMPQTGKNDTPAPAPAASSSSTAPKTNTQQLAVVHIKVIAPDSTSAFDIDLHEGDDLCENLVQAKKEGDISSLQIDDTYLATFGSFYVREINGYSNNWTVEVNGVKPTGCSLYRPKSGDNIVWRFSV